MADIWYRAEGPRGARSSARRPRGVVAVFSANHGPWRWRRSPDAAADDVEVEPASRHHSEFFIEATARHIEPRDGRPAT